MSGKPIRIAPSILAADFARLGEETAALDAAGADLIHLDVMDGHFVPNVSFGAAVVKALRRRSAKPFDVHLMIAPVDPFLASFVDAGADTLTIHAEAGPNTHRTLQAVRAAGVKCGLALNPATPAEIVGPVADLLDVVVIMTVNPGFGGQSFLSSQLAKIKAVRRLLDQAGREEASVEVDGGVTAENAGACAAAGADILVAGSAILKGEADAEIYAGRIETIRRAAGGADAA